MGPEEGKGGEKMGEGNCVERLPEEESPRRAQGTLQNGREEGIWLVSLHRFSEGRRCRLSKYSVVMHELEINLCLRNLDEAPKAQIKAIM